jgi:CheY-like chemotaxis protein
VEPRTTVLVVEDDDTLRDVFRTALGFAGFEVHEAPDGLNALQRIDSDPPDAIVLDLGLPKVDGLVVQQDIAARASTRNIPIIVVTGSGQDLKWLDVQCVLRKPVSLDALVETVRKCVHR